VQPVVKEREMSKAKELIETSSIEIEKERERHPREKGGKSS